VGGGGGGGGGESDGPSICMTIAAGLIPDLDSKSCVLSAPVSVNMSACMRGCVHVCVYRCVHVCGCVDVRVCMCVSCMCLLWGGFGW